MMTSGRREIVIIWVLAILLAVAFALGLYDSLHTGLTWDDWAEQHTYAMNSDAVKSLLHANFAGYQQLLDYRDRFYGIGFHALAYPLQRLMAPSIEQAFGLDEDSAMLLAKHAVVFVTFAASALVFYLLLRLFIDSQAVCMLFAGAYFLYPYLLGHGMMNVKDIPFLFAYLLCTYVSLRYAAGEVSGRATGFWCILLLAVLTAWLIAIRITGCMILCQYLFTFVLACIEVGRNGQPLKRFSLRSAVFPLLLAPLVIGFYPMLWLHPVLIKDALFYMSHFPEWHTTLMFGAYQPSLKLPLFYIPAWLLIKLPIGILLGMLLLPVTFTRIVQGDKVRLLHLRIVLFAILFVPGYLMFSKAALYNELRQVLFIIPLFMLVGFLSLYYIRPRLSIAIAMAYLALFVIDDFRLNPYQYVWSNEASSLLKVDRDFETDYWGISGREMAAYIVDHYPSSTCVFNEVNHLVRPFLPVAYACVQPLSEAAGKAPRPFLITRYTYYNPPIPEHCDEQYVVARKQLFSRTLQMGKVLYCH